MPHRKAPKQTEEIFQVQDYFTKVKITEKSTVVKNTVNDFEKLIEADF
ncbi:hypothetical protein [Coxiella-like endosymbiont of Rhipicephalus sanguineus]|nr:hypothetical protein [Coxiella-like endosymbiont of Rhipicephalus sanguineus]